MKALRHSNFIETPGKKGVLSNKVVIALLLVLGIALVPQVPIQLLRWVLDFGVDPSQNWALLDNFRPVKKELFTENLKVSYGVVPEDIDGLFVRNGPNPRLQETGYHWFDGDGMLHAIRINNGKFNYSNSWVNTTRLNDERKADRKLYTRLGDFGGYTALPKLLLSEIERIIGTITATPETTGTANTALAYHNNYLLALQEASLPYRVRINNDGQLTSLGYVDYHGKWKYPVSAHSKVDPGTDNFVIYGYRVFPPYCRHGVVDPNGNLVSSMDINIPQPVMMHDFGMTEHYSIIMDLPLIFQQENVVMGKSLFAYNETRPSRFGIFPHKETSEKNIKWFEAQPCWIFHTCNSWEEGDEVVVVASRYPKFNLEMTAGWFIPQVWEYRFNLKTGKTTEGLLWEKYWEFPQVHPNKLGRKAKYGYFAMFAFEKILSSGLSKVDLLDKKILHEFTFGEGKSGGEGIFVEKKGAVEEDDGYLLTLVYDKTVDRSALWIIDAKEMVLLTIVDLPQRVPYGFHATFVAADKITK
jgi:carotenoid cleavage dioxygenase